MRTRLLRAISKVEHRGIMTVRAESKCPRKTIGVSDLTASRPTQHLAGRQHYRPLLSACGCRWSRLPAPHSSDRNSNQAQKYEQGKAGRTFQKASANRHDKR